MKILYSQGVLTPEEVVRFLGLSGRWQLVYPEIIRRKEVVKKAKELGITIPDEALQASVDRLRISLGLHSAGDTLLFLQANGLSEDDLECYCEEMLLAGAVKERLASGRTVEEYFVHHRSEFDRARISIIRVGDENLAREIILQVTEEGEDFHTLARRHSVDSSTRDSGGYLGLVSRNGLAPEIASKVFNANAGDLLGPFLKDELHDIILVEEVLKATLNDPIKEAIKDRIFEEWFSPVLREGVRVTTAQEEVK